VFRFSRRDFLKTTVAAGVVAAAGPIAPVYAAKRSATDWVTLGNSGVKVTRLAFGTGTRGGRVQRELGQEEFTKLVRHAYDRGIRFFETAESYSQMPQMLGVALKGLPRDSYRLMTKIRPKDSGDNNAVARMDQMRRDMNTEYFDILLVHCVRTAGWAEEFKRMRDLYSEAKHKQVIRSHGASCHGLLPLRDFPGQSWLDVALLRVNHDGTKMDNLRGDAEQGDVTEVTGHVRKIHGQGTGVIGMKLVGEGRFTSPEDRDASLKKVFGGGLVDAATIGFKSPAEIDDAIHRIDAHLNA
jgi:predicted aldo/keto reductase-like oxidoreductase